MKDGFDTSVAQRMPKMQKRRPNRPWNVDPVLIKPQEEIKEQAAPAPASLREPVASPVKSKDIAHAAIAKAVETIEDLNTEFSQILFEKKDVARKLKDHDRVIEEIGRENSSLKVNLAELEMAAKEHKLLDREILFLNEQLEDADHYIQHVVGMLEETTIGFDAELIKSLPARIRAHVLCQESQLFVQLAQPAPGFPIPGVFFNICLLDKHLFPNRRHNQLN